MKVEKINIDDIISHIRGMVAGNEKITVRGVMARSGGSPAKITEAIKTYYEQQGQEIDSISGELINLIMKEKITAVEKARVQSNKRIMQQDGLIDELRDVLNQNELKLQEAKEIEVKLSGAETKISMLEKDLKISNNQKDQVLTEVATFKQQLQHSNDRLKELEIEKQNTHNKIEGIAKEKQQIEQELTIARAKLEQMQEQLNVLYNKFSIK